jgi:hypothetical protein
MGRKIRGMVNSKKKKRKEYFERAKEKNTVEVPFDSIFKKDIAFLNKFHINKKRTYCNIMDIIIQSNNDILEYDTNNEFLMNYLSVKYKIDKKAYDDESFIKELYSTLITKEFISAVNDYVEKNYQFDLDSKQLKKFNEGLQFTDNHSKILLKISVGMKFVIPLVLHYVYYNPSTQEDLGEYLLMAFDPLFDIFAPNVDIINKLYESVYSRVIVTRYSDRTFWYYCEVMGYSIEQLTNNLVKKLIVDIIPKYAFDKNIISLNHVFINNNIEYSFRYNFPINFKPLNLTESEGNGLTDFDKLAINTARINESEIIMNKVNIKLTIKDIIRKYDIQISKDELKYYVKDFTLNRLQKNMMFLFFSKYFGSAISLYNCNVKEYVTLLVMMKKILEKNNFTYLQQVLTGRIEVVNEKKSLNKKSLLKIIESEKYKVIIKNKFPDTIFNIMDSNIITKIVATILNNKFTSYDFENTEEEGEEIKVNSDIISEEVLRFIEMI